MDESWRMRMRTPNLPRRRSTEESVFGRTRPSLFSGSDPLNPNDFSDVFGGPPQSVLERKLSGESTNSASFYEEIFRPEKFVSPDKNSSGGRILPGFRIPGKNDEFYNDIFGWNDCRRSRDRSRPSSIAKSRSNSSSVLSSEELSPLRPVAGDDPSLSSIASKLRPINVPYTWKSPTLMHEEHLKEQAMPTYAYKCSSYMDDEYAETTYDEAIRYSHNGFSGRASSPEAMNLGPNRYGSFKLSVDDVELNSPSSSASFVHQESVANDGIQVDQIKEQVDQYEDSYVIEISSGRMEGSSEVGAIDEAIAWAKEKFLSKSKHHSTDIQENQSEIDSSAPQISEHTIQSPEELQKEWIPEEEKLQSKNEKINQMTGLLDEDIKLWAAGKETNIRSLLSSLDHILSPESSWNQISLTSLTEISQVKKAYQKARLCLHPDKLQQRGATLDQKYVAEKAFVILQEAWASFISEDVLF